VIAVNGKGYVVAVQNTGRILGFYLTNLFFKIIASETNFHIGLPENLLEKAHRTETKQDILRAR